MRLAGGDARRALTVLEAAAGARWRVAPGARRRRPVLVTVEHAERALDVAVVRYDKEGDQHYDVDQRVHQVDARLGRRRLAALPGADAGGGEDPRFIARRIVIAASEDVGMADPTALQTAVAAAQAVQLIGMPEARIILAQAVVHLATAPKSNASYLGIGAAIADVRAGHCGLGAGAPARLALPGRQRARATARGTATPTTSRTASRPSSTCPTPWPAASTTSRPTAAPSGTSGRGWSGCGSILRGE